MVNSTINHTAFNSISPTPSYFTQHFILQYLLRDKDIIESFHSLSRSPNERTLPANLCWHAHPRSLAQSSWESREALNVGVERRERARSRARWIDPPARVRGDRGVCWQSVVRSVAGSGEIIGRTCRPLFVWQVDRRKVYVHTSEILLVKLSVFVHVLILSPVSKFRLSFLLHFLIPFSEFFACLRVWRRWRSYFFNMVWRWGEAGFPERWLHF